MVQACRIRGGRVDPCPPSPPPLFGRKLKKEDGHFTVKNTKIIKQRNSSFHFKNYVVLVRYMEAI